MAQGRYILVLPFLDLIEYLHFLDDIGETTVARGLRAVSDFEYGFQLANMNRAINKFCDSISHTADDLTYISSTLVRECVTPW